MLIVLIVSFYLWKGCDSSQNLGIFLLRAISYDLYGLAMGICLDVTRCLFLASNIVSS